MYYNEHRLSNQQRERKVKECIGFERWFLMQITRVFFWPIDERSNVDWSIQEWCQFDKRRSTHCQLNGRSIRALRFSKPAYLFWNIGVLRLDEPLSAHCLPIKSQNCQERLFHVEHFTPSISDAKYRLRKGKFRYFGLKSRGIFTFLFPSSPPFSLFLFSFLVLGIYWASFRKEMFWGTQDLWY